MGPSRADPDKVEDQEYHPLLRGLARTGENKVVSGLLRPCHHESKWMSPCLAPHEKDDDVCQAPHGLWPGTPGPNHPDTVKRWMIWAAISLPRMLGTNARSLGEP